jgi:hypothetical protein
MFKDIRDKHDSELEIYLMKLKEIKRTIRMVIRFQSKRTRTRFSI